MFVQEFCVVDLDVMYEGSKVVCSGWCYWMFYLLVEIVVCVLDFLVGEVEMLGFGWFVIYDFYFFDEFWVFYKVVFEGCEMLLIEECMIFFFWWMFEWYVGYRI